MAVAVEMRFAGATLEQYDEVVSLTTSRRGRGERSGRGLTRNAGERSGSDPHGRGLTPAVRT
jgi:hypothetical protein